MDKRRRPKLSPPSSINSIQTYLDKDDYTMFYEIVMTHGLSGADTIRKLIREEYERLTNPPTCV